MYIEEKLFREKIIKECKEFDDISLLYNKWIEKISLNNSFSDVYNHLINHMNERTSSIIDEKWKLSLLNLFNILSKMIDSDIKKQTEILYNKSLKYKDNYDNPEEFYENDLIKQYQKLLNIK